MKLIDMHSSSPPSLPLSLPPLSLSPSPLPPSPSLPLPRSSRQVHISHATKGFLGDNEFQLTEGNGSSRDNFLKERCVVTYLIQQESQSHLEAENDEIKSGEHCYGPP